MVKISDSSVERPDEHWKYPYVAGVVDYKSNIQANVGKASDRAVGYMINVELYISTPNPTGIGFLDEWCETHGLSPRVRELEHGFRLEVTKRGDVEHFLRLVRPYLINRFELAELILTELIPALNEQLTNTKEGFIETMDTIEEIRKHLKSSDHKYTLDYFWNEWDMDSR
jgi:hypothetical protein